MFFKRYVGEMDKSDMVIVNLRLPSGWEAVEDDLESMLNRGEIQRYELNEGRVFIYLDHVSLIILKLKYFKYFSKFDSQNFSK